MKKQILALSMIAALSACEIDNSDAKKVAANFNNEFITTVGFDGTRGEGMDVELTTGHGNASGVITVTDVNYGEAGIDYTKIPEGIYGTFTMTESDNGAWTYDLDETNPDVLGIMENPNGTLNDAITLTSLDGTKSPINIMIKGIAPDTPAEFRGAFVANVSLKETDAYGTAEVYDENFSESLFQTTVQAQYGIFTINENGRWIYELDNKHPGLGDIILPEDKTEESFELVSADGTSKTFTVNITGAPLNFAAQIPSTTDTTSVFAIDFKATSGLEEADIASGKLQFKVKMSAELAAHTSFGLSCADWNGNNDGGGDNRRLGHFYIGSDGQFSMWSAEIIPGGSYSNGQNDYAKDPDNDQFINLPVVFDQPLITPDEWNEITISWDYQAGALRSLMTLSINDQVASSDHGAIPTDPNEKFLNQTVAGSKFFRCMQQARFIVRKNTDNGGIGALYIDDVKFFTDPNANVKFDTPTYADSFDTSNDGDNIKESKNEKYLNITTDIILIVRDL